MKIFTRLFDQNYDGYIDKKEFKWMTTSGTISTRTINIVFEVGEAFITITICQALVPNPPRPNPNPVQPSSSPKRAQKGPKGTGADAIILGA